ncbi:MAG TPA: winged helix-turn-helix domain-containing protein, partial [Blastocatellia bacterium]
MEKNGNKGFVYEFGKFVLDPKGKTLFSGGKPIHLPAKEFETLLLLVENNHKALSKDEMMGALWRDSFVEESNLAKQISRLRKILNSDGEQFIETLPKHGYRFSADLRLTTPAA